MFRDRRLIWTLIISALIHSVLIPFIYDSPEPPTRSAPFEFVLEPAPTRLPDEDEGLAGLEPAEAPQPPDVAEPSAAPDEQPVSEEPAERIATDTARPPLNLERPANWQELVDQAPDPDVRLHFNRGLAVAVEGREIEQRRRGLLGVRRAAVYGVADEHYGPDASDGHREMVKIGGSCYVLVNDPDVESGQRWWPSQCVETKAAPSDLDVLAFDPLGRVLAD